MTTIDQIHLDGTVSMLKISASALQLAKDILPPEKTADTNFDSIISRNLELAEKAMALSREMDRDDE